MTKTSQGIKGRSLMVAGATWRRAKNPTRSRAEAYASKIKRCYTPAWIASHAVLIVVTMQNLIMLLALQAARAFVAPTARRMATSLSAGDAMAVDAATTFLFPGQGAQSVGMAVETCEAVPAAKALFDEASEILGYVLLAKCAEGPKAELDSTAVSQPAIFVSSMAAVEKLRAESPDVVDSATCAMGLSLGEYSALCFAGAISFADGVKLTKLRGEAMQAASDAQPSGMVSVIGLDKGKVADLCKAAADATGEPIAIANFLCNGNYACSGSMAAVDKVAELAKPEFKARMAVKLAVAGAFHTDFMAPAVAALSAALADTDVQAPRIPVVSNVDAAAHADPAVIKDLLAKQVTSPVLFEDSVANLLGAGFSQGYELGPGKVIAGIFKRIDKTASVENVVV